MAIVKDKTEMSFDEIYQKVLQEQQLSRLAQELFIREAQAANANYNSPNADAYSGILNQERTVPANFASTGITNADANSGIPNQERTIPANFRSPVIENADANAGIGNRQIADPAIESGSPFFKATPAGIPILDENGRPQFSKMYLDAQKKQVRDPNSLDALQFRTSADTNAGLEFMNPNARDVLKSVMSGDFAIPQSIKDARQATIDGRARENNVQNLLPIFQKAQAEQQAAAAPEDVINTTGPGYQNSLPASMLENNSNTPYDGTNSNRSNYDNYLEGVRTEGSPGLNYTPASLGDIPGVDMSRPLGERNQTIGSPGLNMTPGNPYAIPGVDMNNPLPIASSTSTGTLYDRGVSAIYANARRAKEAEQEQALFARRQDEASARALRPELLQANAAYYNARDAANPAGTQSPTQWAIQKKTIGQSLSDLYTPDTQEYRRLYTER